MQRSAVIIVLLGLAASPAYGRKTNQPIYEDPFDIAAGGASLTKASKEGMIFSNPALMPQGGKFFRWLGLTTTVLTNKESVDTARSMLKGAQSKKSADASDSTDSGGSSQTDQFVDKVFKDPVRVGWGVALSMITNNFGLSVFSRFEPDIRARQFGTNGLPEVELQAESYHGAALGTAIRTPFRWLLLGVTGKYLYASEPDIKAAVTDQEKLQSMANPSFVQSVAGLNKGVGADVGSLIFLQGRAVDLSLAAKVDDVGGTKLSGPAESPTSFKQVSSAGLGLTLHTSADAIHFAVDYRDLQNAYGDPMFKRVYAGTKITLHTYVGLAAGFYNGYPSMGAEVDLLFCRLAGTMYTRELGDHPGVDPRHIYMISLSTGI